MFKPITQRSLKRRLLANYLLFCMVAVAWLIVGVLTTTQTVLGNRLTASCFARLGRLAASMEIDYLQNDAANLQQLTLRAREEGNLLYCCIVSEDGRYLTHTTRPLLGSPAKEPQGKRLRWGNIDGVQYTDVSSRPVREYRVPLKVKSEPIGSLRLGVVDPAFQSVANEVLNAAPLTLLLPLVVVGCGAVVISRMVKPIADVDRLLSQLARTPANEAIEIEKTSIRGLATAGWNRLMTHVRDLESRLDTDDGDTKLLQALVAYKSGASSKVLDSLQDGIAVTDAAGRIEFANQAIEALLQQDSIQTQQDASFLEALVATSSDAPRSSTTSGKAPVVAEVPAPGAAEQRTLRIERQPIVDGSSPAGEQGQLWCVRDITQQKLAMQSRNDFIDAATHELRTPLANIKAYAETLATCDFSDTEQQKDFCNTINAEATRLSRFVDDLLDISSLEVGSLSAQRQNVDLERLLQEAVDNVRPLMTSRSLSFDATIGPKLGELSLDKDKVSAMVVNLLGNAAKYTPEGGTVQLKATADPKAITIDVVDTGHGISAEELPLVFEKFFRSENPEVTEQPGTGLGLPLAREIARLHGGDIAAQSQLGEGSTFSITLPRPAERDS